ncbi:MAG: adenylate/guanylate cyclase domain-containing protein, partial [Chloroflexota bacterium]|nr:adenylate/guanylate cyclase domain-containing protein [Chloroflexota bacterium]
MKRDIYLKMLFRPRQLGTLLQDFAPLLGPEVSLAVRDETGHLIGNYRSFSSDVASALLEEAQETAGFDDFGRSEVVIVSQGAVSSICVEGQRVGLILAVGPLPAPAQTQAALTALRRSLESLASLALEKRAIVQETLDRYREINLLYNLGDTLATCLDVDELPQRALAESNRIIQAKWGAVLYYAADKKHPAADKKHPAADKKHPAETGKLTVAASIGPTEKLMHVISEAQALMEDVAHTGKSKIINDFTDGERRTSLLIVPLRTSERQLGVILLVDKVGEEGFTAGDEKLLAALSWQAAISWENARLFDNVRRQRDEIATMKNYMDNIFASIASGVITTDTRYIVTTFNRAAEEILGVSAQQAVNHHYQQALDFLCDTSLPDLIEDVSRYGMTRMVREISPQPPHGGRLHLSLNLSTLRGGGGENMGVAIVMDDVTEKRRHEKESALIRRYLPSELVDQLPHDLAELGLHGERRTITAFFADLRGFTKYSEIYPSEKVFEVLNGYLALAEREVRRYGGIVDKYMGDAVMALFNTPLLEEKEHAWRAVQTAWALKKVSETHYKNSTPEEQLFVGIGICTGEAVVGNVGAKDRME